MTLFKIVGGVSLILAALTIYFEMQRYEKLKFEQINSFILLIEYIKNQIECFLLPIDKILQGCSSDIITSCGIKVDHKKAEKLQDLIDKTEFYCDSGCIELIRQFANDFGQGYMQEQLRLCDYYRGELIKEREKLKEKNIKEKKLRLALCLCASISLILLLI